MVLEVLPPCVVVLSINISKSHADLKLSKNTVVNLMMRSKIKKYCFFLRFKTHSLHQICCFLLDNNSKESVLTTIYKDMISIGNIFEIVMRGKRNLGCFEQLTCRKTVILEMRVPKQISGPYFTWHTVINIV